MLEISPNKEILISITRDIMPFGKFKGTVLCNLPVSYLEWFSRQGFPPGKLGMALETLFVIKTNGLDHLLYPLKNRM